MIRRYFLRSLALSPFVGPTIVQAMPSTKAGVPIPPRILMPRWNGQWSPYNPRRPDGRLGDEFYLCFLWDCDGLLHLAQIGGRQFVDGTKIDTRCEDTRKRYPHVNSAFNEAWRIALANHKFETALAKAEVPR